MLFSDHTVVRAEGGIGTYLKKWRNFKEIRGEGGE